MTIVSILMTIVYFAMIIYHWFVYDPIRPNISEDWYNWFRAIGTLMVASWAWFVWGWFYSV